MSQHQNKNQFEITGRLHEVLAEQQVSDKFRKREFVLDLGGQYPEHIKFQLVQDKTSLLDSFAVGTEIKVEFNLRGRMFSKEGTTTYFTNLEAWRIKPADPQPQAVAAARQPNAQL
ncbi:DUF3127 domain-containing protein (plasmid) [Hymenobacter sp. BRD128]|uniref:DUF3127 domain-containing protein n=1 Tax=Hymenobacter sp. BRD128 TaxID=2675878 RepID=UPI001567A374|nr:DUF3127 domain-containing protein [Hymenobacter sp. BRD128]QKG59051.1 DUF3127 domain-containing protein [Hymenobacter sp. BRD128]